MGVSPPARAARSSGMNLAYTQVDSPLGPLTLSARGPALIGLYMHDHRGGPPLRGVPDATPFASVRSALERYFAGERESFEDVRLELEGTPFQRRVWQGLSKIPYGQSISYGELARRIGKPSAARAVGLANGRNPISIVVPCHRVIGASGSLTGYGGGLEAKRRLLELESGRAALAV